MAGYGDFAYFYDKLIDESDYTARCEYLVNLLTENGISEGILLDIACGTGKLTEMLCDRGFDTVGIDNSEDMLAVACEKNLERENKVQYLCQDMGEIDMFGTINAAVCTFDSINHVTNPGTVTACFEKVGLFMEKDGIFIFDVNTEHKHRNVLGNNTFVYDTDEIYCVWQNELEEETAGVHISLDLFAPDENELYERYFEEFDEVIYSHEFLTAGLKKAGFEVLNVFDDLTHNEAGEKTERAIYVCKKIIQSNDYFEEDKE